MLLNDLNIQNIIGDGDEMIDLSEYTPYLNPTITSELTVLPAGYYYILWPTDTSYSYLNYGGTNNNKRVWSHWGSVHEGGIHGFNGPIRIKSDGNYYACNMTCFRKPV